MLTIDDPAQGMIVYENTTGKIRVFNGDSWQALSSINTSLPVSVNPSSQLTGIAINQNYKYNSSVLEISPSDGKALQIPVVKHNVIFNPVAGVICFDPELRSLMIYDGTRWNQTY